MTVADTSGHRRNLIHTEEVTGSIPVSPTRSKAGCEPRPALNDLRVAGGAAIALTTLRRCVVLVPEQRLGVVQRHLSCTSLDAAVWRMIRGSQDRPSLGSAA